MNINIVRILSGVQPLYLFSFPNKKKLFTSLFFAAFTLINLKGIENSILSFKAIFINKFVNELL